MSQLTIEFPQPESNMPAKDRPEANDQPTYQPEYDDMDTVLIDSAYTTILKREGDQYYLSINGKRKWCDAREIDATSTKPKSQ